MFFDREYTPVDIEYSRRKSRRRFAALLILLVIIGAIYWRLRVQIPVTYQSDTDHFKYGSIGSDTPYGGIPFKVWQVLPEMFPEYLPDQGQYYLRIPEQNRDYLDAYASFGFLVEEGHPTPVGFSQRRVGIDLIGLNCAVCHTSTVRITEDMDPSRIYGTDPAYIVRTDPDSGDRHKSALILGMPANTIDLEAYFVFLFQCASDDRFTVENVMSAVRDFAKRHGTSVGSIECLVLRYAIPRLRDTLLLRRQQLHYLSLLPHGEGEAAMPRFGPGRVDTFTPYKSIQFAFPWDGTFGIADYPSIWNQAPREGWHLHWDGNNKSVFERNLSASLGAGASPTSVDIDSLVRVANWIGSPPPPHKDYGGSQTPDLSRAKEARRNPFPASDQMQIPLYPFKIDRAKAQQGQVLFKDHCYRCHGWTGADVGQVVDISYIRTDPARLDSYTEALQANQNLLGAGQWWRFKNFRKTHGYANSPLDGIWARAPYLHNGSVPTLADLFRRPCNANDLQELGLTANDLDPDRVAPGRVQEIIRNARRKGLRPPLFYRGDDHYDPENVGFRCDRTVSDDGRRLFLYATFTVDEHGKPVPNRAGNGHRGHYKTQIQFDGEQNKYQFGDELTAEQQAAIIEYLKTIGERESQGQSSDDQATENE